jgi:hypothetical protein
MIKTFGMFKILVLPTILLLASGFCCLPSSFPTLIPTAILAPLHEGEVFTLGNLEVLVLEHDLTGCVTDIYGEEVCPPEGAAYLWIHLHARHIGAASDLPVDAAFSTTVLYRGEEQDSTYFFFSEIVGKPNWPGYSDGSGNTEMYSGAELDGWLAFIVPVGVEVDEVVVHLDNWGGEPKFEQDWRLAK